MKNWEPGRLRSGLGGLVTGGICPAEQEPPPWPNGGLETAIRIQKYFIFSYLRKGNFHWNTIPNEVGKATLLFRGSVNWPDSGTGTCSQKGNRVSIPESMPRIHADPQ